MKCLACSHPGSTRRTRDPRTRVPLDVPRPAIWIAGALGLLSLATKTSWAQECGPLEITVLTPSDATVNYQFGNAVAMDGDTVIVGASQSHQEGPPFVLNAGSAYVFRPDFPGQWLEIARLEDPEPMNRSRFGSSVAISGDTAIVGAIENDFLNPGPGSVFIFERDRGDPNRWSLVAELRASDAELRDQFGISVSISGDTAVVGAGRSGVNGDFSGSAYIFRRNHGGPHHWAEVANLTPSDAAPLALFGSSVSIDGGTVIIGAPQGYYSDVPGSAYIFQRNGIGAGGWGQVAKLSASDSAVGDWFGAAVSISWGQSDRGRGIE